MRYEVITTTASGDEELVEVLSVYDSEDEAMVAINGHYNGIAARHNEIEAYKSIKTGTAPKIITIGHRLFDIVNGVDGDNG